MKAGEDERWKAEVQSHFQKDEKEGRAVRAIVELDGAVLD